MALTSFDQELELADPERALAVAYAPAKLRRALTALFALDERFANILSSTSEPMIGMMRLAWWREALEKLDRDPAPAEPLLKLLAGTLLPLDISGATLATIEDGWTALIDGEPDAVAIERHGRERGANLFRAAASILRAKDPRLPAAGEVWALADLGYRHSDAAVRATALKRASALASALPADAWKASARPLAALFVLAKRDASAASRAQGSPNRLFRMLALRFTGR